MTISTEDDGSDTESTGLVVQHALAASSNCHDQWILDPGATCHKCNSKSQFVSLQPLSDSVSDTW